MIERKKKKKSVGYIYIYIQFFTKCLEILATRPIGLRNNTTAHLWCGGHSTNINTCRMWGVRAEIQVFKSEFHTHIHLD